VQRQQQEADTRAAYKANIDFVAADAAVFLLPSHSHKCWPKSFQPRLSFCIFFVDSRN